MKEYMMIFRNEKANVHATLPEEQMKAVMQQWQNWIGGLAAKGTYSGTNRLLPEGKTIKPGNIITDGPYAEGKEVVGGYLVVKANSLDEAVELAKSCPGLTTGHTVEVRSVMNIDQDSKSKTFLAEKEYA
jgi:hypothetical protein